MPWSFVRLTFVSGTSDVPEKVSARIRQQAEPLIPRARYMPASANKTGSGNPAKSPLLATRARGRKGSLGGPLELDGRRLLAGHGGVSTPRYGEVLYALREGGPKAVRRAGS